MLNGRLNAGLPLCRCLLVKCMTDLICKFPWFGKRVNLTVVLKIDFHDDELGLLMGDAARVSRRNGAVASVQRGQFRIQFLLCGLQPFGGDVDFEFRAIHRTKVRVLGH